MKTFFKPALVAAAALAAGFTSCSKGGDAENPKDGKAIEISFTQEALSSNTRAVGDHVGTQIAVLSSARIYFATASDDIMDYLDVKFGANSGEAYNAAAKTVGIDEITNNNTQTVEGLPPTVNKVTIVGNAPGGTYYTTGKTTQHTVSAVNMAGSVVATPLYGSSNIVDGSTIGDGVFEADVTVAPVGARIEVGQIAGTATGSTIESFTFKGIYINNYYSSMTINGTAPTARVHNGSTQSNYTDATYLSAEGTAANSLHDILFNKVDDKTYDPSTTSGKVWGFNLPAPVEPTATDKTAGDTAPQVAHVIVHIDGVEIATDDATTYANDRYLTVRNFYLSADDPDTAYNDTTTPLPYLKNGYVYRIVSLKFAESNLTPNPELSSIDVIVEATILGWKADDVTIDFD
ncbi:MAG: hypothetical protein LBV38_05935 [Alistipes sp.]|jgi:hypothetical protein|nr:hypothetical protein [Alistipes sp.]